MIPKTLKGLKRLQSDNGPVNPNVYWHRPARPKCTVCGRKIRGTNHQKGH